MTKILVTGATGNVGIEVVRLLQKTDARFVIGVRDIARAKKTIGSGLEYVEFDFEKPATYKQALTNVRKIFLVRPPVISDVKKYFHPFIDLAKAQGVEHIVFLSLLGVEKNSVVPHHKIEKYILASNIPYTFLRASFFMQNLNTTHREDIRKHNEIILPAGKGKTSFIDVRDIAEVGFMALIDDKHMNKAYDLTGSEALDYYQIAEIFSEVLGRKITYTNPSPLQFFMHMKAQGMKPGFIFVMIALYSTAKMGLAGRISDELPKLIDRASITVEQYVKDYKDQWM